MDIYAILGASVYDTDEEIKKKYRQLAHKYHPDVYAGEDKDFALEQMKRINDAYEQIVASRKAAVSANAQPDDLSAAIWAVWAAATAWAAWADANAKATEKAAKKHPPKASKRQPRYKTNRYARFRRCFDGPGSYETSDSSPYCPWSRVLFDVTKDRFISFVHQMGSDISLTIAKDSCAFEFIYSSGFVHRIEYFAAAEYVCPVDCIKKLLDAKGGSSSSLILTFLTHDVENLPSKGSQVILDFDKYRYINPYAVGLRLLDGRYLGADHSDIATLLSLLNSLGEADFDTSVSDVHIKGASNGASGETLRYAIIDVSVRIANIDHLSDNSPIDFSQEIDRLLLLYKRYSRTVSSYFEKHILSAKEAIELLSANFTVESAKTSPYMLSYHLNFSISPTSDGYRSNPRVNRFTQFDPVRYDLFDDDELLFVCGLCNACMSYDAVNWMVENKKKIIKTETANYQYFITFNKRKADRIAVGIYFYPKSTNN